MGYLAGVARRFLLKFPAWVKTVDVRRSQKENDDRGVHSLQWWSDFTLRLTDLTTLSFAAVMDGASDVVGVHCRTVQRRQLSASERGASSQQLRGALGNMQTSAEDAIRFIDVVSFLPNYLADRDLYRFVLCWSCHRWWRAFPLLPARMTSALFNGLVDGTDVLLDLPADDPSDLQWRRVHAACQCGSASASPGNREAQHIRGRQIMVPRWVAMHAALSLRKEVGTHATGPRRERIIVRECGYQRSVRVARANSSCGQRRRFGAP